VRAQNVVKLGFRVNGVAQSLELDSRVVLLDALRERLALTGSKKGCVPDREIREADQVVPADRDRRADQHTVESRLGVTWNLRD
jgi:hypothetical protein